MRREGINGPSAGMTAAVLAGLRVVLATIAALALLSALLFGAVVAAVVLLWKLLGDRPRRMAYFGWRGGKTTSRPRATQGDVIDVEVREVAMRRAHDCS